MPAGGNGIKSAGDESRESKMAALPTITATTTTGTTATSSTTTTATATATAAAAATTTTTTTDTATRTAMTTKLSTGRGDQAPPSLLPGIFVPPPGSATGPTAFGGSISFVTTTATNASGRVNSASISNVDTFHRAVHKVRLSALAHNYHEVESAAGRQRCSVIVVVKADGYGHGAIRTALFLADTVGADCFAVATLEEAVALRKAFAQTATTAEVGGGGVVVVAPVAGAGAPPTIPSPPGGGGGGLGAPGGFGVGGGGPGPPGGVVPGSVVNPFGFGDDLNSVGPGRPDIFSRPSQPRRSLRQAHIRIMVLGPPVGFPRCFDDYYHHNIECMISGPEVAQALLEWVLNTDERRRTQVERAAAEAKQRILLEEPNGPVHAAVVGGVGVGVRPQQDKIVWPTQHSMDSNVSESGSSTGGVGGVGGDNNSQTSGSERSSNGNGINSGRGGGGQKLPCATLSNVTGSDLAREVREILKIQHKSHQLHHHQHQQHHAKDQQQLTHRTSSSNGTASTGDGTPPTATSSTVTTSTSTHNVVKQGVRGSGVINGPVQIFRGIEEAAKFSRTRHNAMASEVFYENGDDDQGGENDLIVGQHVPSSSNFLANQDNPPRHLSILQNGQKRSSNPSNKIELTAPHPPTQSKDTRNGSFVAPFRRRLRWHALIDSGMGRLGLRTDPVSKEEQGKRRDSVEIIHELVQLEHKLDSPLEFFGMCTHMADATSTSTYTQSQIQRFKSLLKRVRAAGIFVPTISTDNSAALLTENLTHFDPEELLKQAHANSRGFVRTGGAIYGQRPSFRQLQAVSTLMASVRHVAILKKGESVGYDRAYVAATSVRIATLTIGFADGYPRELGNGVGKVSIRGHLFPVAGNVCMDMLMVELGPAGDKTGPGGQVIVGDTAILWGPDDGEFGEGHVRLQDLAGILKTTQSALTCGLNKERVLRQYS